MVSRICKLPLKAVSTLRRITWKKLPSKTLCITIENRHTRLNARIFISSVIYILLLDYALFFLQTRYSYSSASLLHQPDKSNDITICLHHFTALFLSVAQAILVIDSARTFVHSRPLSSSGPGRPPGHPFIHPSIRPSIPSIRQPSSRELNAAFNAMQEAAIIPLFFLSSRVVSRFFDTFNL